MKKRKLKYSLHLCVLLLFLILSDSIRVFADTEQKPSVEEASSEKEGMWNRVQHYYQRSSDAGKQWTKEEIERIGDWQYRVVTIEDASDEELEVRLNQLGDERWEVTWLERFDGKLRVFVKRPVKSIIGSASQGEWKQIIPRLLPKPQTQEE